MNEYKLIKRRYDGGIGWFKCQGIWADGQLAYTRFTEEGEEIEEEKGAYAQIRKSSGGLFMVRI